MNLFNNIKVKVILPDTSLKVFQIKKQDLVFDLKLKIQKSLDYNINYQILKYNNIVLENNIPYSFYNVKTCIRLIYDVDKEKIDNDKLILKHNEIQNSIDDAKLNFMYKAYQDYTPPNEQLISSYEIEKEEEDKEVEENEEKKKFNIFQYYVLDPLNIFMKYALDTSDICTCTMDTQCVICKNRFN